MHILGQQFIFQFLQIHDLGHSYDGKTSEVRIQYERLGICITDTADADIAPHFFHVLFELCPERRVFNAVNIPLESQFRRIGCHTAASCPQM